MTRYSDKPDIMAIGDSMYQGIRSLSFVPAMTQHSAPAQVAAAIGMAMTVPDLQHPLLFDLEAELRRGGLLHLVGHIRDACVANLPFWPLDRAWSQHEAFDNIAIGGAQIASLTDDTYDRYAGQLAGLIARLTAPGQSITQLAEVIGTLWYAINNCYTLNPQHRSQQGGKAALDQVEERQPQILLINIGSNEGLFRAGFTGDFSDQVMQRVGSIPELLRPLGERLRRLPARTERIVFNGLVRPRFIPNLMPSPEHENEFPGDAYYAAYGPRISSTHQRITGDQLRAFDTLIANVNAEAEDVLRQAAGDRIAFADLFGASSAVDGKHYGDRGLPIPGRQRDLSNKPVGPVPFGFVGGIAGLDNMHPTVPGYAVIADAVLDALGNHHLRTDKAAAFAADTLLNNFRGLPFLVAEMELSLLGTFGALGGQAKAPVQPLTLMAAG